MHQPAFVAGRDEDLLVDSGMGVRSLRDEIRDLLGKPLQAVATHFHFDHVGWNTMLVDGEWLVGSLANGAILQADPSTGEAKVTQVTALAPYGDGAIIDMTIEVRDRRQFQRLSAAVRRISGVRDVERIQ